MRIKSKKFPCGDDMQQAWAAVLLGWATKMEFYKDNILILYLCVDWEKGPSEMIIWLREFEDYKRTR